MSGELERARDLLDALGSRDAGRLRALLCDEIELIVGRNVHVGIRAVLLWAQRSYEHLERQWVLDELRDAGAGSIGAGRVRYLWRESGALGDEAPAWFSFHFRGGRFSRIGIHDDPEAAAAAVRGRGR